MPSTAPSTTGLRQQDVELLAPAGNQDCIEAAIENGADAVYFGLDTGFNARARATNFSLDNLEQTMQNLHRRGLRGYVTLNTLAFQSELAEVEQLIERCAQAGVDALLVQDIGVARLARAMCPDLPLHASTQMTITSAETMRLAEDLGMQRVVLARELSLDEIEQIHRASNLELEAFVHGALCVAYSGQCLTSESLGGRSANRGQCAQACRLPYTVLADDREVPLGDVQYLLSPQDLAAYELLPRMLEAGVRSFKIEGRLKTPEYVANITRHYREALDRALAAQPVAWSSQARYDMEMSFSRGFSAGWLPGLNHKELVPGKSSAKRGVLLGTITSVDAGAITIRSARAVAKGDGLVFEGDRAIGAEQGGRVYEVQELPQEQWKLRFGKGAIDITQLVPGQQVWKTDDPQLNRRLRKSFSGADAKRRIPLHLTVHCHAGAPLTVRGRAENGIQVAATSPHELAVAERHPANLELLRKQLGRLGATCYTLGTVTADIEGAPMVPHSVLGELRRMIVEQLAAAPAPPKRALHPAPSLTAQARTEDPPVPRPPQLSMLVRTLEQLTAVAEQTDLEVYAEFQDIREYRQAADICRAQGTDWLLATPRIQKPGEMGVFTALAKHRPDGILARNFAGLEFFVQQGFSVVADFSLNVTNALTAAYLQSAGATRCTPSYDLNRDQLLALVHQIPTNTLEVVIHQHMPMFHMEHCVFCAVLSPGTDKTNCGRPCDTLRVELRDRVGMEHPLTADVGCRNTLYNAVPQSSAEIVPDLCAQGVHRFRVELLREDAADAIRTAELYQRLLSGEVSGSEVWRKLKALNRVGVTRGTLEDRDPLAII